MERDTVLEAWASLEAQLKQTQRLNDLIVVESLGRRAQTPLQRERFLLWLEVGINALAIVALGSFAADRFGSFAGICAAILGAVVLTIDAVLIGIAVSLSRLDLQDPVIALQAELARIKKRRAALVAAALVAGPLLWAPLLVVLVAAAGLDPVSALGVPYIAANFAFGFVVAGAALLIARLFGERLRTSPWISGLIDALSGQAYRQAADYLDTIERYCED